MALLATTPFASYDVTDGAQVRDISPVLAEAIYFDLNLLEAISVDFGDPVYDTKHWWNEDALNADTFTISASATSTATSLTVTSAGEAARCHVGDLFFDTASGSTEVMQITNISGTTLTITRTYNSTVAASIASGATLALIRAEQEASDIGSDRSVNPTVRVNYTQIFDTFDLQVSGSQLARRMATTELADWVAHQLANRAIEMKINLSRAVPYSETSASVGSDTVYRTFAGMRNWIRDNSGVVASTSETVALSTLSRDNKTSIDKGGTPNDRLIVGTDLVKSITAIDTSNRRLLESDTTVGYRVQEVVFDQGNAVRVVVDSRIKAGDAFMANQSRVRLRPMNGRGMFVIAATDFTDAKKRRILGEWTFEYRHPETGVYMYNKA